MAHVTHPDIAKPVGVNIRKARERRNLSQFDLVVAMRANTLGIPMNTTPQSVSRWENGDVLPSLPAMIVIGHVLEASMDDLLVTQADLGSKKAKAASDA